MTGNNNATIGIFFDSFAKIAVSIAVLGSIIQLPNDLINQQIIPSVCFGLFVLNLCYFWQARQISYRKNVVITALPSGLQASCVFVWLFGLMLPIVNKTHNPLLAYQVALLANLINAVVFTVAGLILIKLQKFIPKAALFSGLAGTSFTWLAVNNIPALAEHPLSGLLPLFIILAIMIAKIKIRIPLIMFGVVLGTIIAIMTHEFTINKTALQNDIQLNLPHIIALNLNNQVISYCMEYLPLILAFAIIDAISAVQILEESKLSNESFNPAQSITISGVISGLSTLIGNPFAMALFFGHYSWKQQGADHRYSLYNGLIYLLLGITGGAVFMVALIPNWVTLPILIIIGFTTTAVSFANLEKDEYIILILGMVPILVELVYNELELLALQGNITNFMAHDDVAGMFILAKGSILFSLLLTSMFYYIMRHRWYLAGLCNVILLLCSVIGLIHSQTPALNFTSQMNYMYLVGIVLCCIMGVIKRDTKL